MMIAVLAGGLVASMATAGLVVMTVSVWRERAWGLVGRVYFTLVTLAAVAWVWFLNQWNLLGFRF